MAALRIFAAAAALAATSLLLVFAATGAAGSADRNDLLKKLAKNHPRLIADTRSWTSLADRRGADRLLDLLLQAIERDARGLLTKPPLEFRKTGRRLLSVSRLALQRITTLAAAGRLTGDPVFTQRAEAEMLALAGFSDWNPSHFLDVAEMTAALALGYDWLFELLPIESRETIRRAIVEKGLRPGLDPDEPHNRWHQTENNWNQVCFGGLTLGALAVAEDEPELARKVLTLARRNIEHGLVPYQPDGIYPEGPAYWSYGTTYQVLMIGALQTALGENWDLPAAPGFLRSAAVYLRTIAPSGLPYNFADGAERADFQPALFWFARQLDDPGMVRNQIRFIESRERPLAGNEGNRFLALAALWWPDAPLESVAPRLARNWRGDGANPIAVFRSSWTEPGALYFACKGGSASLNHAHMDAGSFVFEVDGVRWARDLGAQNYESLESKGVDLWTRTQDSQRWEVFRLNNRSHNTLTIDGQLHRMDGRAEFLEFVAEDPKPRATIDLSRVFAGHASQVVRSFEIDHENKEVRIHDELAGLNPGAKVRWAMVTAAEIDPEGSSAILREDGRELEARIMNASAAGEFFNAAPADPPDDDFNAPNPNRRILLATFTAPPDGKLTIDIQLSARPRVASGW